MPWQTREVCYVVTDDWLQSSQGETMNDSYPAQASSRRVLGWLVLTASLACTEVPRTPSPSSKSLHAEPDAAGAPPQAPSSGSSKQIVQRDKSPLCLAPHGSMEKLDAYKTVMWVRRELRRTKELTPLDVAVGQPLDVVFEDTCLSSCYEHGKHVCSVELVGTELRVSSTLSYERVGKVCPEGGSGGGCHPAVCSTPALAEGSYTLVYGEAKLSFAVPGKLEQFCLWGAGASSRPAPGPPR